MVLRPKWRSDVLLLYYIFYQKLAFDNQLSLKFKSLEYEMHTFLSCFYVVSQNWSFPGFSVWPAEANSWPCFGQLKISDPTGGARLGAGRHISGRSRAVVDGLGPDGKGVGDPFLQVLNVEVVLLNPLLYLLREI